MYKEANPDAFGVKKLTLLTPSGTILGENKKLESLQQWDRSSGLHKPFSAYKSLLWKFISLLLTTCRTDLCF